MFKSIVFFTLFLMFSLLTLAQTTRCEEFKSYVEGRDVLWQSIKDCDNDYEYIIADISDPSFGFSDFEGASFSIYYQGCNSSLQYSGTIDSEFFFNGSIRTQEGYSFGSQHVNFIYTNLTDIVIGGEFCYSVNLDGVLNMNEHVTVPTITNLTSSQHCDGKIGDITLSKEVSISFSEGDYSSYCGYSYDDYLGQKEFKKSKWSSESQKREILYPGIFHINGINNCSVRREFVIQDESCGVIDGALIFDKNKDCSGGRDYTENYEFINFVSNKIVTLQPGNYKTITDKKGYYYFTEIPFGSYTISIEDPYLTVCTGVTDFTLSREQSFVEELLLQVQLEDDFSVVEGRLAIDNDLDCRFDYDELVTYQKINFNDGEYSTETDDLGNFFAYLPYGNYSISLGDIDTVSNYCNPQFSFSLDTLLDDNSRYVDLEILAQSGEYHETSVVINSPLLRPGFEANYSVTYRNTGTFDEEGVLLVVLSDEIILGDLSIPVDEKEGDTLKWKISTLNRNRSYTINFDVSLPADVDLLGDSIVVKSFFEALSDDETIIENNSSISNVIVRGSYDPNDITLLNPGRTNYSSILLEDEWLNYRIRFQNTGTYKAEKVVVIDTLPVEVDFSSIVIEGASHRYVYETENDKVIKFTFSNIELPAAQDDEPKSHGWIKYKVMQNKNNNIGDVIENGAGIYFDYNPAIITNRTINPIEEELIYYTGINENEIEKVVFYPNPATSRIEFTKQVTNVQIYDVLGVLLDVKLNATILNLENYPNGFYFLRYEVGRIVFEQKLIKQ